MDRPKAEVFSNPLPPLPDALQEGAGWAIVLGFGFVFSLLTSLIVYLDYNFGGTAMTSEEFNTAGRSIKTGLTASVTVSQWTWAATLLQSSNVAWKFGVSGPFWCAPVSPRFDVTGCVCTLAHSHICICTTFCSAAQ